MSSNRAPTVSPVQVGECRAVLRQAGSQEQTQAGKRCYVLYLQREAGANAPELTLHALRALIRM